MVGEGDAEFEDVFRREFGRLVATAYGIVGDWEVAKELVADAFVAMLVHWKKVRGYDNPAAWLRRVLVRDAIRSRRRAQRTVAGAHPEGSEPNDALDLRAAVLRLPVRQRAAVVLHYLDDLPVGEVAVAMGCSEGTVKTHLSRARESLAMLLREEADRGPQ
jgi:RNA polymerase sigma-70 factor, ECF subfamily